MEPRMTDTTFENEHKEVTFIELKEVGTGSIEARADQQERLEEFTQRVGAGEFHRPTTGTIPCLCIDGRNCSNHGELLPNSAGGSETLMVADDLTTKRFVLNENNTTAGQYENMLTFLKDANKPIGGHTTAALNAKRAAAGQGETIEGSGCGANDKLPAIYAYMAQNADKLRELARDMFGYEITDADHALIIGNAAARSEFSGGAELLGKLRASGGRDDALEGEHNEVMAVVNRRTGTTLDRTAVEAEFGDDYQAFEVDEWSFEEGARVISTTGGEDEVRQKRIAMLYYNLAAAGVLCGPKMRVVILD